jgi:hypothetical protein
VDRLAGYRYWDIVKRLNRLGFTFDDSAMLLGKPAIQLSPHVRLGQLGVRWLTDTSQLRDSRDSQLRSVTVG